MALVLRLHLLSNRLLGNLNGFFRNVGVTQNTMELVARPHGIQDTQGARDLEILRGDLEFRNVSFDYGKPSMVLEDINLRIKSGEKVGIVGPSGSGKTTLVHLAMRFFDPSKGEILIDGQDISKVKQASVRQRFAFVQQDVQLFNRTVFENIAYGVPDATQSDVEEAAELANAHEFILELEDGKGGKGYQAKVGERGVKLSGGQRQRLAIARAMLRNTPFLILDEATSQLDSVVEEIIQANLLRHMKDRTVVVIAHRLSTIVNMDRIIVMDGGRIIGEGSHKGLLSENVLYNSLWKKQSRSP